jgi:hypothetical protein
MISAGRVGFVSFMLRVAPEVEMIPQGGGFVNLGEEF